MTSAAPGPLVRPPAAQLPFRPPLVVELAVRGFGLALLLLPFLPPFFYSRGETALGDTFDVWTYACHRMPERSLTVFGEIMPLCSRCYGIMGGLGLGMLVARPFWGLRQLRISLTIGALFLFVELTSQDLGWHDVFHPTRLLSGFLVAFPVGAAAGALARGWPNASAPRRRTAAPPAAA
jgi:uncharacterized membrane protein